MHGKIAKQMYPKILYHAPIVDVRAIHHAYNSHQTWSYPWNAIDGNVSNVNSVPFAVLQIMMINCCSAMIVIEGMHFTNISYPYLPFYVCSSVVKLKIVEFRFAGITCIACHRHWQHHQKASGAVIFATKNFTVASETKFPKLNDEWDTERRKIL